MVEGENLSFSGRVTLAKVALAIIPIYVILSMVIPKGVCLEIDKIIRNFIWGHTNEKRRINHVKWDIKFGYKFYAQNINERGWFLKRFVIGIVRCYREELREYEIRCKWITPINIEESCQKMPSARGMCWIIQVGDGTKEMGLQLNRHMMR
ncbi:Retrovirus-related Pol polyprotein LINE-1 [Gossypium australe]|uniref:Retrovirus-related Pol polyprotein LINE-1 n=1 Tax=Gossypium australe TaxID=47621 RepID=A0A5B6WRB6_9ROSI|nr:Retrovirus-related Pol polyprotein LINE-1 [Gossypium australe]